MRELPTGTGVVTAAMRWIAAFAGAALADGYILSGIDRVCLWAGAVSQGGRMLVLGIRSEPGVALPVPESAEFLFQLAVSALCLQPGLALG